LLFFKKLRICICIQIHRLSRITCITRAYILSAMRKNKTRSIEAGVVLKITCHEQNNGPFVLKPFYTKRKVPMNRLRLLLCALAALVLLSAAPVLAAGKPMVLKITNVVAPDTPLNVALVKMSEILDAKSGGTLKLEVFPSGQLGNLRECLENLQVGTLEMMSPSLAALPSFTNAGDFLNMPYLFKDEESAEKVLDGEIGDAVFKELEKANFIGLAWMKQGMRHLTTSNREVHAPADVKGLKIRTMDNPLHMAHFKALGASPIPMSMTELLSSLQQGVVDGQENPYVNIKLSGYHEVQKYIIETAHLYDPVLILASKPIWDTLTPQQRQWIRESAIEAAKYQRELTNKANAEIKEELKKNGRNVVIELTPEQWTAFRAAVEPVYKEYSPKYNGIVEKIEALQR